MQYIEWINIAEYKLLKKEYTDYLFLNNLGKNISRQSFFLLIKEEAIKKRLQGELQYFGEYAPQKHLFEEYNIW